MKTKVCSTLVLGMIGTMLAGCGSGSSSDSINATSQKQLATRNIKASAACYTPWSSTAVYTGGQTASYNGENYTADYWTRSNPSTSSGASGTGQPWIPDGACGSGTPTPTPGSITSGGYYTLVNPNSNKALDVSGASTADGAQIDIWDINGTVAQVWQINQNSDGTHTLVNPNSNKALDVYQAGTGDGNKIDIWDQNGTVAQKWTINQNSDGTYTLVNPNSNKALDVYQAATTDGTVVDIWDQNGTVAQKWAINPTSSTPTPPPPPPPTPTPGGFLFSPYKDVTADANWNNGALQSFGQSVTSAMPGGDSTLSWAFATGACGSENWGGISAAMIASNVSTFVNAGKKYIVSTGGADGSFSCSSDSGFDGFINTYNSNNLVGIDFDIEGGQTQSVINNLVARVQNAQSKYPNLRFSFTIATLATSNGASTAQNIGAVNPLGTYGNMVMSAIQSAGLSNYYVNLMTMDYGGTSTTNCVVSGGSCEMGQSAIQAAMDFSNYFHVPYSHIELTPMAGVNDTSSETFTIGDVSTVSSWAKSNGLGGLHFWSFDRDTGLSYTNAFVSDLGL